MPIGVTFDRVIVGFMDAGIDGKGFESGDKISWIVKDLGYLSRYILKR